HRKREQKTLVYVACSTPSTRRRRNGRSWGNACPPLANTPSCRSTLHNADTAVRPASLSISIPINRLVRERGTVRIGPGLINLDPGKPIGPREREIERERDGTRRVQP
ncbi:unnamed protein product, partial [Ectocarpus sp. 8 AP-2014]